MASLNVDWGLQVPNDEVDASNPKMPGNLHNAAELLVATKQGEALKRMWATTRVFLALLKRGPDGSSTQSIGRAAICWRCGHTGLPRNAARCHAKRTTPAPVCANCANDDAGNFLRVTTTGALQVLVATPVHFVPQSAPHAPARNPT
eukprot:SAG11_NODE_1921_length_4066_cov_4.386690_2_plen_147_part_00